MQSLLPKCKHKLNWDLNLKRKQTSVCLAWPTINAPLLLINAGVFGICLDNLFISCLRITI